MNKAFQLVVPFFLCSCFAHIPMHTTEHLKIAWRTDYATAQADAWELGRPILVVMIAGEKEGAICLGGDYLRSSALRDDRVIEMINEKFVPVWLNVRKDPLPQFPFIEKILVTATLDHENRVNDTFSKNYFLRSVIVSPDGLKLLNPGAETVAAATRKLVFEGDFTYESIDPGDYLSMLMHALERFKNNWAMN